MYRANVGIQLLWSYVFSEQDGFPGTAILLIFSICLSGCFTRSHAQSTTTSLVSPLAFFNNCPFLKKVSLSTVVLVFLVIYCCSLMAGRLSSRCLSGNGYCTILTRTAVQVFPQATLSNSLATTQFSFSRRQHSCTVLPNFLKHEPYPQRQQKERRLKFSIICTFEDNQLIFTCTESTFVIYKHLFTSPCLSAICIILAFVSFVISS